MSDAIRPKDRFLVELEVVGHYTHDLWHCTVVGFASDSPQSFSEDELRASKRLPRALKVGDRVRAKPDGRLGIVIAVHEDEAWVDHPEMGCCTYSLSGLTLAEESAS